MTAAIGRAATVTGALAAGIVICPAILVSGLCIALGCAFIAGAVRG